MEREELLPEADEPMSEFSETERISCDEEVLVGSSSQEEVHQGLSCQEEVQPGRPPRPLPPSALSSETESSFHRNTECCFN